MPTDKKKQYYEKTLTRGIMAMAREFLVHATIIGLELYADRCVSVVAQ